MPEKSFFLSEMVLCVRLWLGLIFVRKMKAQCKRSNLQYKYSLLKTVRRFLWWPSKPTEKECLFQIFITTRRPNSLHFLNLDCCGKFSNSVPPSMSMSTLHSDTAAIAALISAKQAQCIKKWGTSEAADQATNYGSELLQRAFAKLSEKE